MKLSQNYYLQPTLKIAQDLLGKVLIRKFRNKKIAGIITETEAYIGFNDKASHASQGKTKRNQIMFMRGGRAYVYLIYGMYYCFNIVTEEKDSPAAVLIRAIQPINITAGGLPVYPPKFRQRREARLQNINFHQNKNTNGPGKLCKYLKITKTLNNEKLSGPKIWLEDWNIKIPKNKIKKTPRIGVNYAGKCKDYLWRFLIR